MSTDPAPGPADDRVRPPRPVGVRRAQPPRGVPAEYEVPDVGLGRLLDDAVQDFPDGYATAYRGRRLTYRELADQVDRVAGVLTDVGVGPGERVVVALPASLAATTTLFAVWRLGATVALVDPTAEWPDRGLLAQLAGDARVLVAHDRLGSPGALDRHMEHVLVTGAEDELPAPRNLLAAVRRWLRPGRSASARLAHLVHRRAPLDAPEASSEVTSRTALVVVERQAVVSYDHASLVAAAFQLRLWLPDALAGTERVCAALSIGDAVGVTAGVTFPVLTAARAVIPAARTRRQIAAAVDAEDPTVIVVGTDPAAAGWVEALRGPAGSLRVVLHRGPVAASESAQIVETTGARVRSFWAPAGAAAPVVAEPVYGLLRSTTLGIPLTATYVEERAGRLAARGPQLAGSRCGPDGWLVTDLAAEVDDDGYVAPTRVINGGPGERG